MQYLETTVGKPEQIYPYLPYDLVSPQQKPAKSQ